MAEEVNRQKTVLLTGATGFIGSATAHLLFRSGYTIHLIVRPSSNLSRIKDILHHCHLHKIDLTDHKSVEELFSKIKIDYIFHIAGVIRGRYSNWEVFHNTNVETTRNLLQFAPPDLQKFLYVSTVHTLGLQHDISRLPLTEESPYAPDSLYARSKQEAEELVKKSGRPYVILRPAIVYGPGDRNGFVTKLIKMIEKSHTLLIPGNGENFLHLVYITDLVKGFLQALESSQAINKTYILAGSEPIKLDTLIKKIASLLEKQRSIRYIPLWPAVMASRLIELIFKLLPGRPFITEAQLLTVSGNRFFSSAKAAQELGYHPEVMYHDGLKKTIEWYRYEIAQRSGV